VTEVVTVTGEIRGRRERGLKVEKTGKEMATPRTIRGWIAMVREEDARTERVR